MQSLATLLQHFGSVEAVFTASRQRLRAVLGSGSALVDHILAGMDAKRLARDLDWLTQPDHHLLTWHDPHYPRLLREIARPPVLLFVAGDKELLTRAQLAIVGSRNPTPTGLENAYAFARTLSRAGLVVTSGLALGIDGAAHRGALDTDGRSIAVFGTGLERVYPAQHEELASRLVRQGAVVSEFPLGTAPKAENFPRRNRIISGLSLGTLVVEAAAQSGSLITARCAAEQGREVFAIPGSIHSPLARGCHALLREGAKLVEDAHDIIEELGALAALTELPLPDAEESATVPGDPYQTMLLTHIGYDPVSIDTLVERSGLTAHSISSMLVEMELLGIIAACPGGRYMRT